ncbi:MAG: helix-turn-helix domain-containing protein [Syntrophales bacterium]
MAENQLINAGFMDIQDLSDYLKVKTKTLYAMISDIPHYRVGKLIRFKKPEIDSWMDSKRAKAPEVKPQPKPKRKLSETANNHIDRLIRNVIDQTRKEGYNPGYGKSDHIKGLMGKEVDHGLI